MTQRIGSNRIANNSITVEKIANGAITNEKLADAAFTSGRIADGAVTTGKIANGAITNEKLSASLTFSLADTPYARAHSNSAYNHANAAFIKANTAITTSGGTISGDTDIFLGDITSGTVSTDSGVLFTGSTSNVSGIFTEVNGTILSYGINIPQIDSSYSNTVPGGIFRLDTRQGGGIGDSNCFVVKRRSAGSNTVLNGIIIDLNDGNTILTPQGGNVGISTNNPSANLHVSGDVIMDNGETASSFRFGNTSYDSSFVTSDIFVLAANETAPGLTILSAGNTSTGQRGVFKAVRSRGSLTSPTAAQNGDFIFSLLGAIHDGTTTRATAAIEMVADGVVSSGVAPQRIVFYTGSTTSRTERMRITNSGNVLIGSTTDSSGKLQITGDVSVNGLLSATTKSFIIDHPTKKGKKLRYGSLEGPENGVYVRGETTSKIIKLPEYWTKLIHADSITVNLTAKGEYQQLFVEKIENNKVYIKNAAGKNINCFYTVYGERADVDKLEVEYADKN